MLYYILQKKVVIKFAMFFLRSITAKSFLCLPCHEDLWESEGPYIDTSSFPIPVVRTAVCYMILYKDRGDP